MVASSSARAPRRIDVDTLWQLQRIGSLALAPDGTRAVCAVATPSIDDNTTRSALWLLPTTGGAPRQLTHCGDKDGQPAWSPRGDCIAFVARREQQGRKDATPQLYLIAPDGGEARRLSSIAAGVESFRWLPDGQRIVLAAWMWPALKGIKAQNAQHAIWAQRQETGYATSEAFYRYWDHNIPQDRVLHLLLLDTRSGRVTDLMECSIQQLPRDTDGNSAYAVHPDGRSIAFSHDPAGVQLLGNPQCLTELDIASGRMRTLASDAAWDIGNPSYSPDGTQLACTAAHVGRVHTATMQLALVDLAGSGAGKQRKFRWRALGAEWDYSVDGTPRWTPDGSALLFTAEDRGRRPLWRHDLGSGRFEPLVRGGTVQAFDTANGVVAWTADSAIHPARAHALRLGDLVERSAGAERAAAAPLRLETFNDALLQRLHLGRVEDTTVTGALGEPVQVWLTYPPNFDPKKKHSVVHMIHGGPFAAAGDSFGYRWNSHVFAAAGHVVVQVNFHGSSGFGHAFRHSLIGRQGDLELQDIEATTSWLLQQRWADPQRIFATGGSYGGFLVAWMNGHVAPGRYRAYVCHAGVFDRVATFSADSYPVRPKDLAASWWQDMPRVHAQSPHAAASAMRTPTLVIHGARDYRVPDCNGLAYYNTLKALGVDARLLWFPDENHWVLKPRNSQVWYAEFLAWLERHGKPRKAAKVASLG